MTKKTPAQLERRKRYQQRKKARIGEPNPAVHDMSGPLPPAEGWDLRISDDENIRYGAEEEPKISLQSAKSIESVTSAPTGNDAILAAIQGLGGMVQELAQNTAHQLQQMDQRIATIEEAQSQGLLTLGSESAIYGVDPSFGANIPGAIPQSQLVKSRGFQDVKVDEHRILSEPGLDLPDPTDDRIVVVGTTTEAEKLRRQAMREGWNQGGY